MVKHNNAITHSHFKKDWEKFVKTWFDQPAKKLKRHKKRAEKAARIFPRPLDTLRPVVHCPTLKYSSRAREGRGFTLKELALAKIDSRLARTIGIAVDSRRKDRSVETQSANVQRLLLFKSKLVLFPRKSKKPRVGDSTPEEISAAVQQTRPLPFKVVQQKDKARAVTEKEKTDSAYATARKARMEAYRVGDAVRKANAAVIQTTTAPSKKVVDEDDEGGDKKKKGKK